MVPLTIGRHHEAPERGASPSRVTGERRRFKPSAARRRSGSRLVSM